MKLVEIPVKLLVELQFEYMGETHKVTTGLLYNINQTVYVSAIKSAALVIPASKLKNVILVYKSEIGVYSFHELLPRSISYNGQSLYAINSEQEAMVINHRKAYRMFVGTGIVARIIKVSGSVSNLYCILKDISATGMGIVSNQKIDMLSKIEITFNVNQEKKATLIGNIIHMNEFANGKGFHYGCEFDEPNEMLGKYIAKKQEEMGKSKVDVV